MTNARVVLIFALGALCSMPGCLAGASELDSATQAALEAASDGGSECMQLSTWPQTLGGYVAQAPAYTWAASYLQADGIFSLLELDDYHRDTQYPKTVAFGPNDTLSTCDACLVLESGCSDLSKGDACQILYFAQAGSVTFTRSDTTADGGRVAATLTDAKLVQWQRPSSDGSGDKAAKSGLCVSLPSTSFEVSWVAKRTSTTL